MEFLGSMQLPSGISSIAICPAGRQVAVVSGATLHLFQLKNGRLTPERNIELSGAPPSAAAEPSASFKYKDTQVILRDEHTAVIARIKVQTDPGWNEQAEVFLVDLGTGAQRGRLLPDPYPVLISGLIPAPPDMLLGLGQTVVRLDADSLEEIARSRPVTDDGDADEADAVPEETIRPGGFTYDAERGLLTMLCGYFNGGALSRYRWDATERQFVRESRRDVCETRPSKDVDLPSTGGICLNPRGDGVIAVFELHDLCVDSWGQPMSRVQEAEPQADATPPDVAPPLQTARLGWLAILGEDGDEWHEVLSEFPRDFDGGECRVQDPDGETRVVGYRLCSADGWFPQPVACDDHRVLLATPSGMLQIIDTITGDATLAHDFNSPISALQFDPGSQTVWAGGQDGTLTVISLENH